MKTKQEIKNVVERESYRGGFDFRDISVEELKRRGKEPHFKMQTLLETKKTEINYDPSYETENQRDIGLVVRDGTRHEVNHHRFRGYNGCPRTLDKHVDLIYEPMNEVLAEKGYSPNDTHYISNALEDTILHHDLSKGFALEGIIKFLQDVGECSGSYTLFYEAHARLNMALWGNKKQKRELKKFYTTDKEQKEKILKALNGFFQDSGINKFIQGIETYERSKKPGQNYVDRENQIKSVRDRQAIRDFLNNEKNWPAIAKAYAENFSALMQPGYAQSLMNHNGAGTKGRETEDSSGEGNEFDREMDKRDFKRARIQRAYSEGEEVPSWINRFDALDLIYESLAKRLTIKAETFTRQDSMPIFWYGSREFDPETDDFKHISLGVKDSGEFEIRKKRWHESVPLEVKISPRGFPRARFGLIDCSGSMREDPSGMRDIGSQKIIPWGDNSKYHYGLLAWYGFLEYLKQNHLLNQNAVDLAGFSDETVVGKGLLEAKRVALSPQFRETNLDLDKVKTFFEGRGNLVFSISDGEIQNWDDIKNEYLKHAGKHYYFHLQIGKNNKMTNDLKNAGLYVDSVLGGQDLVDKTIDLTDKILRGETK